MGQNKMNFYHNHREIEDRVNKILDELNFLKSGLISVSVLDETIKQLCLCEAIASNANEKSEIAMSLREVRVLMINQMFVEKFLSKEFLDKMIEKMNLLKGANFSDLISDSKQMKFESSVEHLQVSENGEDDLFGKMWTNVNEEHFKNVLCDLTKMGVSLTQKTMALGELDKDIDLILIDVERLASKEGLTNELINLKVPTIVINSEKLIGKEELKKNQNILFWEYDKQHITTLELICLNLLELHRNQILLSAFSSNMMVMFSTIDSILKVINEDNQIDEIKNEFKKLLLHKKRTKDKYLRFIDLKSVG